MPATWANRATFEYDGNIPTGTTIRYGEDLSYSQTVTADQWTALLAQFQGRSVELGTSFDAPPPNSIGEWWKNTFHAAPLMSYMGPILVLEGFAQRNDDGTIQIF